MYVYMGYAARWLLMGIVLASVCAAYFQGVFFLSLIYIQTGENARIAMKKGDRRGRMMQQFT